CGMRRAGHAGATGNAAAAGTGGRASGAAIAAKTAAWGVEPLIMASGGSIPLVNALQQAVPEAEILLLGATDGYSNIHAPDERVLPTSSRRRSSPKPTSSGCS